MVKDLAAAIKRSDSDWPGDSVLYGSRLHFSKFFRGIGILGSVCLEMSLCERLSYLGQPFSFELQLLRDFHISSSYALSFFFQTTYRQHFLSHTDARKTSASRRSRHGSSLSGLFVGGPDEKEDGDYLTLADLGESVPSTRWICQMSVNNWRYDEQDPFDSDHKILTISTKSVS